MVSRRVGGGERRQEEEERPEQRHPLDLNAPVIPPMWLGRQARLSA